MKPSALFVLENSSILLGKSSWKSCKKDALLSSYYGNYILKEPVRQNLTKNLNRHFLQIDKKVKNVKIFDFKNHCKVLSLD